jgi:hypothetical protein
MVEIMGLGGSCCRVDVPLYCPVSHLYETATRALLLPQTAFTLVVDGKAIWPIDKTICTRGVVQLLRLPSWLVSAREVLVSNTIPPLLGESEPDLQLLEEALTAGLQGASCSALSVDFVLQKQLLDLPRRVEDQCWSLMARHLQDSENITLETRQALFDLVMQRDLIDVVMLRLDGALPSDLDYTEPLGAPDDFRDAIGPGTPS